MQISVIAKKARIANPRQLLDGKNLLNKKMNEIFWITLDDKNIRNIIGTDYKSAPDLDGKNLLNKKRIEYFG